MNAEIRKEKNEVIKNILVALDASEHSDAALRAAMTLARTLRAEVKGMFVRDETWKRVTRLPAVSAVNITTGDLFTLKQETMEMKVSILQNRLLEKMRVLGELNHVSHTWEFTEGNVKEKILDAASKADLITIGQKGQSVSRKAIGSTAEAVIRDTEKPVVVIHQRGKMEGPVLIYYDGSAAAEKGLKLAIRVARHHQSDLVIGVEPGLDKKDSGYLGRLHKILSNRNTVAEIKKLDEKSASLFLQITNEMKAGLFIVPKSHSVIRDSLDILLSHIHCPVLLMN